MSAPSFAKPERAGRKSSNLGKNNDSSLKKAIFKSGELPIYENPSSFMNAINDAESATTEVPMV